MPFMYSWIALGKHKGLNSFFLRGRGGSLNSCVSETRTRLFPHLLNEHLLCTKALCHRVGVWVGPLLCL